MAILMDGEWVMNNRFKEFADSPIGRQIIDVIDQDDRIIELAAFSREGFPAVTALVSELEPILQPLRDGDPKGFNFAKQFVGDHVGNIMKSNGYEMSRPAKSVPGKLFNVGAVWKRRADG